MAALTGARAGDQRGDAGAEARELGGDAVSEPASASSLDARTRDVVLDIVGELLAATPATRGSPTRTMPRLRAARPWSLAARLTRALAGALAAIVFALVNGEVWRLSDALGWPRLAGLTIVSAAITALALILGHDLLERGPRRAVAQFNRATILTVAIGVLTLQAALFASACAAAALLVHADVFAHGLRHPAELGDYLALAWLASSIAMIGGALGVALESDDAVRHAAYRYTTRAR